MANATDLFHAAERLLEVAVEALDTLPALGLKGAPERRYVSPGLPAFDCTQLTVHAVALSEELTQPLAPQPVTGSKQKVRGRINLVNFTITPVRCIAIIKGVTPPSEVKMLADADQIYADGWAIWEFLYGKALHNDLFGSDICDIRRPQSSHIVDPAGGYAGWTIQLQTQLDGYANQVP